MNCETLEVLGQRLLAQDSYELSLRGALASQVKSPGQFVNLRIGQDALHVLRRPISIADYDHAEQTLKLVYRVVGEGTAKLSALRAGDVLDVLGPLGNGYDLDTLEAGQSALLVGGGIGVPPLYGLAKAFRDKGVRTIHLLGFNQASEVFYREEFEALGETHIVTVDGSVGYKGFVTDAIRQLSEVGDLRFDAYYSCGPLPMLKALSAQLADQRGYLSLEQRMACGMGACYACVCHQGDHYSRICYDGPVYEAGSICLEEGQ